jgi:Restriction endonuclease NaeI
MADHDQIQQTADSDFKKVIDSLNSTNDFDLRASACIRGAVNEVLRGDKTGRYSISQLTKQEKAHIGTQVEIAFLRDLFDLRQGHLLDTTIAGVEVDIKNTIGDNWMIPHEAVGQVCLLISIAEEKQCFSVGLVRTNDGILNKPNQDGKRSLSAAGKAEIHWLLHKSRLPVSIFLTMPEDVCQKIWSVPPGQARVTQLFRLVQDQPIHRSDVATLAQQFDPAKRVRDAKKKLRQEGILLLSGRYGRLAAEAKGYKLRPDEWISLSE